MAAQIYLSPLSFGFDHTFYRLVLQKIISGNSDGFEKKEPAADMSSLRFILCGGEGATIEWSGKSFDQWECLRGKY
jgi:hypothetical protein